MTTQQEADIQPERERQQLAKEITERFGSVHSFCKQHPELNRSTVYMVLRGTYAGNRNRQHKRIAAILHSSQSKKEQIFAAIRSAACNRCSVVSQTSRCHRCDKLFTEQATAVLAALLELGDEVQL